MTDIILTPTTVDEIEFYVSNDGSQVELSISGLARLCGIDRAAISKTVNSTTSEGVSKTTPKWLEPLMNKVFMPGVSGINGAKIIDHKTSQKL